MLLTNGTLVAELGTEIYSKLSAQWVVSASRLLGEPLSLLVHGKDDEKVHLLQEGRRLYIRSCPDSRVTLTARRGFADEIAAYLNGANHAVMLRTSSEPAWVSLTRRSAPTATLVGFITNDRGNDGELLAVWHAGLSDVRRYLWQYHLLESFCAVCGNDLVSMRYTDYSPNILYVHGDNVDPALATQLTALAEEHNGYIGGENGEALVVDFAGLDNPELPDFRIEGCQMGVHHNRGIWWEFSPRHSDFADIHETAIFTPALLKQLEERLTKELEEPDDAVG